jgi:ketosteroid isomerase-like protein
VSEVELSDDARGSIANLVYSLAEAIDEGDLARVEALFADATFTLAGREPRVGGAAFREVIAKGMRFYDGSPRTLHVVTNLAIDVAADGATASSHAYITVLQAVPPDFPLQAVMAGRYRDAFRRDGDGRWHFTSRLMHVDLVGDTSFHSPSRF